MINYLSAFVVLFLPGLAVLAWLHQPAADWFERLADGLGISISLTALLAMGFYLVGAAPGGYGAAAFYGLAGAGFAAGVIKKGLPRISRPLLLGDGLWIFAGAAALAGLLAFRFYQARELVFPNWVDSVHHTLIVRTMLEYGGLPPTLRPYLDVPFFYHYAFHILAALFAFLTRLQPDQAVLWLGQVLNALVALSVYRFGRAAGQDRRAAGLAGLLVGFVLQMPAYYLSWGRYTLLTGLILLPLAMAAALEFLRQPDNWRVGLRLGLLVTGLCLAHYLALLLMALFLLVLGASRAVPALSSRRDPLWRLAGVSLGGVALGLPWLIRMLVYSISQAKVDLVLPDAAAGTWQYLNTLIGPRHNTFLMAAAVLGLLLALWQGRRGLRTFAVWTLVLCVLSIPYGLRLGPFRPDHYVIVLFFPTSILLAELLTAGADALAVRVHPWLGPAMLFLAAWVLVLLGVRETGHVINPVTILADRADRAALDWVNANTPPTARFFINSTAWQFDIYRGVDGGYWLTPYTGRASLIPPVVYTWGGASAMQQVKDWSERGQHLQGCTPDFWQLVREDSLTYVYVRDGKGNLKASSLDECARLRRVYSAQGVSIYEIIPLD